MIEFFGHCLKAEVTLLLHPRAMSSTVVYTFRSFLLLVFWLEGRTRGGAVTTCEPLRRYRPGKTERKSVRTGKMVAYFRPDEATDRLARELSDYI